MLRVDHPRAAAVFAGYLDLTVVSFAAIALALQLGVVGCA
jgi:hypothetical protein